MIRKLLVFACLSLAACGNGHEDTLQGYVEAEYLLIGPEQPGRIVEVMVERGQQVQEGDVLFRMEDEAERAAKDEAQARLNQARARLADLGLGQRPEEIAVIEAQLKEAMAERDRARRDYQRQTELFSNKVASEQAVDNARAAFEALEARVARIQSELSVAKLPARTDVQRAAQQEAQAAVAQLAQAEWRLSRMTVRAPKAGVIEDILRWPGEAVAIGASVISLLPPENHFVRFFVPQSRIAELKVGQRVIVTCDGCAQLQGRIRRIASEVEFTPPVIYSVESRDKLVFMVEADFDGSEKLAAGMPVDVSWSVP